MEPCQSGLTYLFAKEAGCKSPREFESPRLRKGHTDHNDGRVAELVDAYASGAYGAIHGGSSPLAPTKNLRKEIFGASKAPTCFA